MLINPIGIVTETSTWLPVADFQYTDTRQYVHRTGEDVSARVESSERVEARGENEDLQPMARLYSLLDLCRNPMQRISTTAQRNS